MFRQALRIARRNVLRNSSNKFSSQRRIESKPDFVEIVDRTDEFATKELAAKATVRYVTHDGLNTRLLAFEKSSPLRILERGEGRGKTFYPPGDFGQRERLQKHFEDNIDIHSLQTDREYIKSIYRSHDFYNAAREAEKKRASAIKEKYKKAMESFCAIDIELVETEDLEESLARVTVVDGNFKILLDKFVRPRGGTIIDHKNVAVIDIEERAEDFEVVRAATVEAIGWRTIIGHRVADAFIALHYLPPTHQKVIDLALDNRVNFEVMVRNNLRHGEALELDTLAFILLSREIDGTERTTIDDCATIIDIFHYMYHKIATVNEKARKARKLSTATSALMARMSHDDSSLMGNPENLNSSTAALDLFKREQDAI